MVGSPRMSAADTFREASQPSSILPEGRWQKSNSLARRNRTENLLVSSPLVSDRSLAYDRLWSLRLTIGIQVSFQPRRYSPRSIAADTIRRAMQTFGTT